MSDITSPRILYVKGLLFLIGGILSAVLLLAHNLSLRNTALLAICVWCFCRFYYFTFYVIEHYVDDTYRFSGLWSFLQYAVRQRFGQRNHTK